MVYTHGTNSQHMHHCCQADGNRVVTATSLHVCSGVEMPQRLCLHWIWAIKVSNVARDLENLDFVRKVGRDETCTVSGHLCTVQHCSLRSKCICRWEMFEFE